MPDEDRLAAARRLSVYQGRVGNIIKARDVDAAVELLVDYDDMAKREFAREVYELAAEAKSEAVPLSKLGAAFVLHARKTLPEPECDLREETIAGDEIVPTDAAVDDEERQDRLTLKILKPLTQLWAHGQKTGQPLEALIRDTVMEELDAVENRMLKRQRKKMSRSELLDAATDEVRSQMAPPRKLDRRKKPTPTKSPKLSRRTVENIEDDMLDFGDDV